MTSAADYTQEKLHLSVVLADSVRNFGNRPATRIKVDGAWKVQTYKQFDRRVQAVARALIRAGVERGDRVALFANNCPEWSEIDFACLRVGAISVPLYATSTAEQIGHIVGDSGSKLIFIGGSGELDRVKEAAENLPELGAIISINEVDDDQIQTLDECTAVEQDEAVDLDTVVAERLAQASEDDIATLIYTSGTTGLPKGVMLTNKALVLQIGAVRSLFRITPEDHSLSFLPLSHALERAWTAVVLASGCMNTYLPNAREVSEALVDAKPTMLVSVPKLFETVHRIAHERANASKAKKKIFDWALKVGANVNTSVRKGRTPAPHWAVQLPLANLLVLKNLRNAIGGPKTVMACGGAPVRVEVEEFFTAAGIPFHVGYGLTEASPLVSFNSPQLWKYGTVGKVMEGGELKIGDDSEILYRGPNLMAGYWNNDEATAETIKDGWLYTGDAGTIDADGVLTITDRLKDIIVTSGGKNVAPQPIEGMLLADPLFEHAVLVGEGRPFLTLLVRPSLPALNELAEKLQVSAKSQAELVADQRIVEAIKERVNALTAKLPSHEQIKDIRASVEEFTMENGLLTPTLKVRRREVEKRFKETIDDMYAKLAELRKGKSEK